MIIFKSQSFLYVKMSSQKVHDLDFIFCLLFLRESHPSLLSTHNHFSKSWIHFYNGVCILFKSFIFCFLWQKSCIFFLFLFNLFFSFVFFSTYLLSEWSVAHRSDKIFYKCIHSIPFDFHYFKCSFQQSTSNAASERNMCLYFAISKQKCL